MKIEFYNYQAYLSVVEGLTMEGKKFAVESHVNITNVCSELDHYTIILED